MLAWDAVRRLGEVVAAGRAAREVQGFGCPRGELLARMVLAKVNGNGVLVTSRFHAEGALQWLRLAWRELPANGQMMWFAAHLIARRFLKLVNALTRPR